MQENLKQHSGYQKQITPNKKHHQNKNNPVTDGMKQDISTLESEANCSSDSSTPSKMLGQWLLYPDTISMACQQKMMDGAQFLHKTAMYSECSPLKRLSLTQNEGLKEDTLNDILYWLPSSKLLH